MNVNVKSVFNICNLSRSKRLLFVSLLFMVTIISSCLISDTNGMVKPSSVIVKTEAELRDAINTSDEWIGIGKNIVLKETLEIPAGKCIALTTSGGSYRLIGAKGMDTLVVKSGGELSLRGGIVVTHEKDVSGRGVYVERGGTFVMYDGVISGNSATNGGGVYNEGTFELYGVKGVEDRERCVISGNSADYGGGVYNTGTFRTYGGEIFDNRAVKGGGVYIAGVFDKRNMYGLDGVAIFSNVATGGEDADVFVEFLIEVGVHSEVELIEAISAAPDNKWCTIDVGSDIVLEKSLEIPDCKRITLESYHKVSCLIGAKGLDVIVVKSGGELALHGGIVVAHADGVSGRGVYVERGGTFWLTDSEISGNSATKGGGIYNEGAFVMNHNAIISDNAATKDGGGVYNAGDFTMQGGTISGNIADGAGGGVYNAGTFTTTIGDIINNSATKGGGVYNKGAMSSTGFNADHEPISLIVVDSNLATSGQGDNVFIETMSDGTFYLLLIGVVTVVGIVVVLFFYRSKRVKQLSVKGLDGSNYMVRCLYEVEG